jgi:hypothetical protein
MATVVGHVSIGGWWISDVTLPPELATCPDAGAIGVRGLLEDALADLADLGLCRDYERPIEVTRQRTEHFPLTTRFQVTVPFAPLKGR